MLILDLWIFVGPEPRGPRLRVLVSYCVVLALCGFFTSGCRNFSFGPTWLPEVNGQVLSEDTNTPVVGAEVFVTYYEPPVEIFPAGIVAVITLFATTNADGRFHFPRRIAPTLGSWIWEIQGPLIRVFHPHYGFRNTRKKQRSEAELRSLAPIELSIFALPNPQGRKEETWLCGNVPGLSSITEKGIERYRELDCFPGGRLVHRNGQIAVEGPYLFDEVDANRTQKRDWTFYAADGSIAATGRYGDGKAIFWTFFATDGEVLSSFKFCPLIGRQDLGRDCPFIRGQNPPVQMLGR